MHFGTPTPFSLDIHPRPSYNPHAPARPCPLPYPYPAPTPPLPLHIRNRSVRALWHSNAVTGVEAAVNWLLEHEADQGLDEPLMVSKVGDRVGR